MNKKTAQIIYQTLGQLGCLPYVLVAVCVVVVVIWWSSATHGDHLEATVNNKIDITPVQVQSIEDIGQWEFLSVSDEELVDTVSHGFFGDDELMRIYYGTLRLGIDLHKAKPQWLTIQDDSVVTAVLPPIELLDRNFIDEAQSKSFFESGSWEAKDRQHLYDMAYKKMLARCLTPANIKTAEQNAISQMTHLLHTMGFEHVSVTFEHKDNNTKHKPTKE